MRYRALTASGDYAVSPAAFWLVNSPASVAQAIKTRLKLLAREWFLDSSEGLDTDQILGTNTQSTRDMAVRTRILGTKGVVRITKYQSTLDARRQFLVTATVDTLYGQVVINQTL